jgi:hypothetical protein
LLNQLLELLRAGGTYRVADLAHTLDTTPALVEVMLEDLGRRGYLKRLGGTCAGKCGACPLAGACTAGGGGQVWALVDGVDKL